MDYKKLIREYRKARGLTQRQIAKHLDVTVATIQTWEAGSKNPSPLNRMLLAEYLGIPRAAIMPELNRDTQREILVNEPDLIALVEACRRIPVAKRAELLDVMQMVAEHYAEPVPHPALAE